MVSREDAAGRPYPDGGYYCATTSGVVRCMLPEGHERQHVNGLLGWIDERSKTQIAREIAAEQGWTTVELVGKH